MKRLNQLILLITVLCLTADAGWIDLGGGEEGKAPDITLIDDDVNGCRFLVTLYGFYLDTLNIQEGTFTVISLPAATHRMEKGNPELPKLDVSIIIPDNGGVSCEILNEELRTFDVLPVIPSKGSLKRGTNPDTVPYTFNDIYFNGEWYPATLDELREPFIICNYRGITVRLNVFRHNPAQRMLEVARKFEVVLSYENPQPIKKDTISSSFFAIYKNLFLNFSQSHYDALYFWKDLLIITHPNFLTEANRLADWKMKKGFLTYVRALNNWTSQMIKDTINSHYRSNTDLFVILIGDPARIPYCRYERFPDPHSDDSFPTDVRYVDRDGNNIPDAFISRISTDWLGNVENIRRQIDKILDYEKLPPTLSSRPFEWLRSGLVISSQEYGDRGHKTNYASMLERNNIFPFVERLWNYEANPTNITTSLEGGRGFVNFLGHGDEWRWRWSDPSYTVYATEHAYSLQNFTKWPFIIGVACRAGWFASPCLGDAFQWMGYDGCGAVGYYGFTGDATVEEPRMADSVAIQCWAENWTGTDIFPNTMGPVLYRGGIEMIENYGDIGVYNFYIWHIHGDVTMQLRGGQQDSVRVSHPRWVYPGWPIVIKVLSRPYGSSQELRPCPNAVVTIWRQDFLYPHSTRTDQNGQAIFYAPPTLGTLYLTVTKNNMSSYEGRIGVSEAPGPDYQGSESEVSVDISKRNLNLSVTPSVASNSFVIKIPYYANSIDIYNGTGKLVMTMTTDKSEFIWNGADKSGRLSSQGIYFIKANGKDKSEIKRLILMR
ncbi:MAG: C25 family cysteine peptidase [candidate division WOR-3 bacterium]